MKGKYSYFDKLCALNYRCLMINSLTSRKENMKHCSATLNER